MRKPMNIDFERCTSGIEFEEWVRELLGQLRMKAERVVKNDCGIDIIAIAAVNKNTTKRFYIQCKYYNKPLGKGPIQEIFAGTAHHKDYGEPVVITNNYVTFEARKYVAIQSKLLRGLNRASSMEAGVLLKSFQNYLDRYRYCSQATEEELCTAYCAYYAVKFQLMHLAGRYQHVTEEYERRLVSDEMIVRHGRRVKSQYTASQWVGSISKAERVKSRDGAESLMESVRSDGVRHADDYFIMAKYLEHHIQSGTPGEGWREVAGYLESPAPVGEISSSGEAVNQAILYRDLFEAAQKAGSDQAIAGAYLKRAKEIVRIYQLLDQKSKIRKVERDLGKGGKQGKYNIQAQQVNIFEEGLQQPVLYAAFSGTIDQIAKSDIDRLSAVCGEDMREDLRDARDALERGDESGLKRALKKVCQMGGELITNVASEALIAYLRQNGLLP